MKRAWLCLVIALPLVLFAAFLLLPAVTVHLHRAPEGKSEVMHRNQGLRMAIFQYHNEFAIAPTGTASQILSQLIGNNERRIVFLQTGSETTNRVGELCDPWGTPFQISIDRTNPVTRDDIAIRSAGPDRKFDTRDDVSAP